MRKQLGAATAVDFVLTLPIFVAALLVIVQLAMLAHASLVVRQAAFSAARSARVHLVDSDHAFRELTCCFRTAWLAAEHARLIADAAGADLGEWREKATAAAMNTLISISPGSTRYLNSSTPGALWNAQFMTQYFDVVTADHRSKYTTRNAVLLRKSRYAFDESNTIVEIETINFNDLEDFVANPGSILDNSGKLSDYYAFAKQASRNENNIANVPVTATVTFRFPLQIPFAAPLFSNVDDDPLARLITITVDLS